MIFDARTQSRLKPADHGRDGAVCRACMTFVACAALLLVSAPVLGASVSVLTPNDAYVNGVGGVTGLANVQSIAVSPDGLNVYAASPVDDAVTIFSRDNSSGKLTHFGSLTDGSGSIDGLDGAAGVAVSPDGAHVYIASLTDNAVAVFSRNPGTGALTFVEAEVDGAGGASGLKGAYAVTVSADGQNVYVASLIDGALAVFDRNPTTGALNFVEAHIQGENGVEGMTGANSVVVSSDDKNVYVASINDNAVAIYTRNSTTGALTFLRAVFDGVDGVEGLVEASRLTVSPDGAHVYVASYFGSAIATFIRNEETGDLSFNESLFGGPGGLENFGFANAVLVSPDGRHVFVAAEEPSAVLVFTRNENGGSLAPVQSVLNDGGGASDVTGMNGPIFLAQSPNGAHLYVASFAGAAIHAFNRRVESADVNGDSVVDAVDIQLVINAALDIPVEFNCDVNADGNIDALDVQLVINRGLGL